MNDDKAIQYSKDDTENLSHLSDLLHLFHHRNKNQHRRSLWWRHFSIFRRQLNRLVEEIKTLNEVPKTHLERSRKKVKDRETQSNIAQRRKYWQDVLVPKWQNAFSQIVADGRFAVLGLVLLAALAQVCQINGIITAYDDLGQAEVEKVLEDFSKEQWEAETEPQEAEQRDDEDLGVVITREEASATHVSAVSPVSTEDGLEKVLQPVRSSKDNRKPPRKKRRTGNAIDDLFSGLG